MPTIENLSLPEPQASPSLPALYVQLAQTLCLIIAHPDCLPAIRNWLVELITIITEAQRPFWMPLSKKLITGDVRSH
jgi:hypothetical protein